MIAAIIVLYNCETEMILKVINSLINQVNYIILVKNDDTDFDIRELNDNKKIFLIDLMNNYGIAYAQNKGVEKAKELNAELLLFSDQDTIYPNNFSVLIKEKIREYPSKTIYAPVFYNLTKQQIEPLAINMNEISIPKDEKYISVFHAISSGTVVFFKDFEEIGNYNEDLFIDYVDFEWCWKARSKGYKIFCFPDIKIDQNLGENCKIIFWKKITIRSNFRYYYMIRNGLILSKISEYLTYKEKKQLRKRSIIMVIGILILNCHILNNMKTIIKAFVDYKRYIKINYNN